MTRNIDGAARDVQAAISAARADLPTNLRSNLDLLRSRTKPAVAPIAVLTLTSDTLSQGQIYDAGSTVLTPALSQIDGIGQVTLGGSSLPAVRVELNPLALNKYGIGLEDVRAALAAANANSPKGAIEPGDQHYQIYTNDQVSHAVDYFPLIVAYRDGSPVRLLDIAQITDSVENLRNQGLANGKPSVLVILYRQPNANIIDTVDRVKASLPQLSASIPAGIDMTMAVDRTTTIRASLHDVEVTLVLAICLVILVVFAFLRNLRATLIPTVAVPVSLIGTGVRRDVSDGVQPRQSLADGADDLDRVCRRRRDRRAGECRAAHRGRDGPARGGAARRARGRLHGPLDERVADRGVCADPVDGDCRAAVPRIRDDAVGGDHHLAARFADPDADDVRLHVRVSLATDLRWPALSRQRLGFHSFAEFLRADADQRAAAPGMVMLVLAVTVCLNIFLLNSDPEGILPATGYRADDRRHPGRPEHLVPADAVCPQFIRIIKDDPAVENVVGFTGGSQTNSGFVFVALKLLAQRHLSVDL